MWEAVEYIKFPQMRPRDREPQNKQNIKTYSWLLQTELPGSNATDLSVILLIITRGSQWPSRGLGLGGGGRALSHATDGKKKY